MFTLQARENQTFFARVHPDGSVRVDVMTQDQANADPNCHFNWEGTTPFAIKTADGRFVGYGGAPGSGILGSLVDPGIYAYSDCGTRFGITEFDHCDAWLELSFTFESAKLAFPVEAGQQLYLRPNSDGDDDTVFYANFVPS
ncbi:hypothetical protein [Burkholderia ambifaria]|uniref:Uncharacterized protein n=1 Tax=Burkholderia ambifaria TaxID=152480 RepID=A0AA41JKZ8_9BURK|nr:hypothetical protein [Burkholderia ambifaria]MBR8130990.1 hypothetical protein [Burkholderia ambifaria]PRE03880.1 hypothetical protein C6P77_04245 [Burkholderia ambifaria]UEP50214.1 hypothetical protein LMA00_24745 [Burkholderia ambifaria]